MIRLSLLFSLTMAAQSPVLDSTVARMERYRVQPDITYQTASGVDLKLDVYRYETSTPNTTVVYIHGGGWQQGSSKASYTHWLLPYMQMGWNIVNVEYRRGAALLDSAILWA